MASGLLVRIGAEDLTLGELPDGRISVAGASEPFLVVRMAPGTFRVSDSERSCIVFLAASPAGTWAFVEGEVFDLELIDNPVIEHKAIPPLHGLSAPMPATVIKVCVSPGQWVQQDETLLILEAMKMELPLKAPRAGHITAVRCREGELVQPGQPLFELA